MRVFLLATVLLVATACTNSAEGASTNTTIDTLDISPGGDQQTATADSTVDSTGYAADTRSRAVRHEH